tara:strand:+ start:4808 stop:5050 length:243 start_codon:yes stop_codon:yes gene_type:complete
MAKSFTPFQTIETGRGVVWVKPLATLNQRHLGWKVISLQDFDEIVFGTKTHVVGSAIITAAQQPESSHPLLSSLKSVWRD